MVLTLLVLGGGLMYGYALMANQRTVLIVGATLLLLSLGVMLAAGGIDPLVLPFLALLALLAFALKRLALGRWHYVGWAVFIILVLALGFRLFPGFQPVATLPTPEHRFHFPPEKVVLMLLVPPLVPWVIADPPRPRERPWRVSLRMLAGILAAVVPLALLTDFVTPGLAGQSLAFLAYGLAYNLLYTGVLEESFFRGLLQNAVIRGFRRSLSLTAARAAGIALAALLFGLAHVGGGATYGVLATLAGIGYGLTYALTGRLHHAVLVHFAVNTVHRLVFSGT